VAAGAASLIAPPAPDAQTRLLVTDGVFSMDGDIAPLPDLATAAAAAQAWLVVDDAHGLGVIGATGRGSCEHFGLGAAEVPILVGTFGKAFGTFGAFVAGDADVIEYLIQKSRTYIYTTALPPAVAAATRAALRVSEKESWRREKVLSLSARFRRGIDACGLEARGLEGRSLSTGLAVEPRNPRTGTAPPADPPTAILPIIVGDEARALAVSTALEEKGFLVAAIRPPTVPAGTARLRVTFSATHEEAQVDALLDAFEAALTS
jgi:8-amino-7-oxononanoate synthase